MFQEHLSGFLSSFVQTQYDNSVAVIVNQTKCINKTTALFELTIVGPGPAANYTLNQLLNDININLQGLDIGIGVIKGCMQNCTAPTIMSHPSFTDDDDQDMKLIYIAIVAAIALFIMMMLCIIVVFKRSV